MATPSVLTVPSMYGDGILYSGPSAYGSELATQPVDLQVDFQAAPSGGVIVDANTFTTSGVSLEGIRSKDAAFVLTVGTAFEIEIRGTTTSNGITLGSLGNSGNEYGSGFGVHRFVSLNNRLWIRQNSAGTTTITHLSIRPLTQGSDFDFTRSTTGTRINEDGYIEDVPYNLLSYTEQLTDGYWNKLSVTVEAQPNIIDPKNGRGAFKVTDTSGGGTSYLYVPSIADANYGRSVYARTVSGTGTVSLLSYFGNTNNDFTLTEQWQRFYVNSVTTATGQSNFYVVDFRAGDLTEVLLYAPQMTKSPDLKPYLPTTDRLNLPRLNYPVYGGCPSLLMEEQRTNSIIYNSQLDDPSYTSANLTISANQINSPEGISNADKLTETTANGIHYVGQGVTSALAGTYTFSGFLKKGTSNYAGIRAVTNGFTNRFFANLDLTTGEITSTNTLGSGITWSYGVEEYSNGWFRLYITGTHSSGNLDISFGLSNSASPSYSLGFPTYTGSTSNFVYAYGFQVEAGSYPTSLMHTSNATFTRNQDVAENAGLGTTDTFNDSEGVLYGELRFDKTSPGNYIGIDDGTTSNRIIIGAEGGNIRVYSPGFTFSVNNLPMFGVNKIAFSWQTNLRKLFINGVKLGENTGAYTGPTGLNQLAFDSGSASQIFDGEAKAVAVYKTALTDTELANLTSYNNHDLFIPYRSRMQMISADQELQCTEHDITRFL